MSKLTNYVDTLVELGLQQGLSANNDVAYKLSADVLVIISYDEPTDHVFPLDGVWIVADVSAQNYKQVLKRSSKTPANGLQNTWAAITEYDDLMRAQQWDASDLPAPVIVSAKGGQLNAALLPRIVSQFLINEAIPRSYADAIKSQLSSGFSVMLNNLNNRVTSNAGQLNLTKQNLAILDSKVTESLESGIVRGKLLVQDEATPLWAVQHDFGAGQGFVFCLTSEGEIVWPEKVYPAQEDPTNVLLVEFLEPVSGFGLLVYIPQ